MSYASTAEPIKIGYLMDFLLSDDFPQHYRDDLTTPSPSWFRIREEPLAQRFV
jgi:hypothetical protein